MTDRAAQNPSPPSDESTRAKLGAARYARFDGVFDGRGADPVLVRALVERINAGSYCHLSPDFTGNTFSLLADDTPIPADRATEDNREAFRQGLQAIADAVPPGARLESTLRSTEVFELGVRETLYTVQSGVLKAVMQVRPVAPDDSRLGPAPRTTTIFPTGLGRGHTVWIGLLLVIAFGLTVWRTGYLDRLLAPSATELVLAKGRFDRLLAVKTTKSWGMYVVTLERGPSYPETNDSLALLLERATVPADRAAINAVANGDAIYVRLQTVDNKVLESARIELRALITSAKAKVKGKLWGRIGGARIELALDSGRNRD